MTCPSRWASWPGESITVKLRAGTEPGLEATEYFGPQYGAAAFGVHAMILEVDLGTMMVEIKRYVVVEDCGTILNPLILDGQIHGSVAIGIGKLSMNSLSW
jgi:CO/xanthine dehydrogenase Mo-binding subunit